MKLKWPLWKDEGKGEGEKNAHSLSSLISLIEERELVKNHPQDLKGQKVLEVAPSLSSLVPLLKSEKGAKLSVSLKDSVVSHGENLPFLSASFDVVFLRLPFFKGPQGKILREGARVLESGGRLVMSVLHPFSLMVQQEFLKNSTVEEGMTPGFERYLRIFGEQGLKLEAVKEVFYDNSLRKFLSTEDEKKKWEVLKRTPLEIIFWLRKN